MAKLHGQYERAERDLVRAFNKWIKIRAQINRAGKKLEKQVMGVTGSLGGDSDVLEMIDPGKRKLAKRLAEFGK